MVGRCGESGKVAGGPVVGRDSDNVEWSREGQSYGRFPN